MHVLLPLIGGEELDDDDMEGMPDELQYQPEDKVREPDPDLRKMLLETLLQLAASRVSFTFGVLFYPPLASVR